MCAVEDVHQPKRVVEIDPKTQVEKKPEDVTYLQNEVIKARARRELVQENKLTETLQTPPEAPEPPFKVTGGINLGQIDLQEQQRLLREEAKVAQQQAQNRIDIAEKAAADAREALNKANLEHLQTSLTTQIQALQATVQTGSKRDIFSELESIEQVAAKLGFARGGGGTSSLDEFKAQLELKRLEQELKREDRKFALELKRDERMWQLELRKLEQQKIESEARLESEKQRWAALASIPEQLGGAWAAASLAKNAGGVASRPAAPAAPAANPGRPRSVEADEGASGQIPCPVCNSPVAIGPTATKAVCATCGQTFNIIRAKAEAPVPTEQAVAG